MNDKSKLLPAEPLSRWLRPKVEWAERTRTLTELASKLHTATATLQSLAYDPPSLLSRKKVEDWLTWADVAIWDLYGFEVIDPGPVEDRFCGWCAEPTITTLDYICSWCGGRTEPIVVVPASTTPPSPHHAAVDSEEAAA